jgi:hypothetical protein
MEVKAVFREVRVLGILGIGICIGHRRRRSSLYAALHCNKGMSGPQYILYSY